MIKIGITGGIGSGKTTVAALFEILGVPVFIADEESKRLADTSPRIRRQLTDLLGSDLYPTSQGLDRPLLASRIFSRPDFLQAVNAIIHPEVNACFLRWADRQTSTVCAIETAILFESGFNRTTDLSLMIYAPLSLRLERACRRTRLSAEEITRRMSRQLSDETKKELSDHVILNDDCHALLPQTEQFLAGLM
ncbi:Dephospho-CoA kinase [Bacteroidales bacterium Barb6XT]|nr:Dephospho-CoA kinase [Bacteroidales bacterium Barb6XT]